MDAPAFRALGPSDAEALSRFFERNDRAEITGAFDPFPLTTATAHDLLARARHDRFYGAFTDDGELVAFSMLRGWDEGYEVPSFGIFVDHARHGMGLGAWTLDRTLEAADEIGAPAVRLSVYAGNPVAARLYRSRGFEEVERAVVRRAEGTDERIVMLRRSAR